MWALTDVTMSNIEIKQEKVPVTPGNIHSNETNLPEKRQVSKFISGVRKLAPE